MVRVALLDSHRLSVIVHNQRGRCYIVTYLGLGVSESGNSL
jgi:hypothetical protein